MAKLKKNNNLVIVLVLAVVVIILARGNTEMFAFITSCDNNEPTTMAAWDSYALATNTTILSEGSFNITDDNITTTYELYIATLNNNQLYLTVTPNCQTWLEQQSTPVEGEFASPITISGHEVTMIHNEMAGDRYLWCNKNNNIMLSSFSGVNVVSDYFATFEVCTTTEINETQEVEVQQYIAGNATITPIVVPVNDTINNSAEENTFSIKTFSDMDRTTLFTLIILGFLVIYFVFEAGPNKGLIRGKKK